MLTFLDVDTNIAKFCDEMASSLADENFIKLTLSNYKGREEHLQKILVRIVETKKGSRLFFQYRYETRDVVKNYDFEKGLEIISGQLAAGFRNGHLFTTKRDLQLDIGKRTSRLNIGKPSLRSKPSAKHDRSKTALVDPASYYLRLLGITTDTGEIRAKQHDKWKQINKFVEVLAGLCARSALKDRSRLRVVDMGSGKGYLTFAAYDYFRNTLGLEVSMLGVDTRNEQIELCSEVARAGGLDGLEFKVGRIADLDLGQLDILIALHACDTATDDAIYKGITGNAEVIVTAPCCHRELRAQLVPPDYLAGILRHPVMLDRTAETLTDGLRSLLLERSGYSTRMFEFIATEHTPKNNMITAVRGPGGLTEAQAADQITAVKKEFGIASHRLETLLLREGLQLAAPPI
jgi:SAM-dependent methyltransferase